MVAIAQLFPITSIGHDMARIYLFSNAQKLRQPKMPQWRVDKEAGPKVRFPLLEA